MSDLESLEGKVIRSVTEHDDVVVIVFEDGSSITFFVTSNYGASLNTRISD